MQKRLWRLNLSNFWGRLLPLIFVLLIQVYTASPFQGNDDRFFSLITECTVRFGDQSFDVARVNTPQSRQKGLMYRYYLAPHKGMLFEFPTPKPYSFWMSQTFISLDIIWLNDAFDIVDMMLAVPPLSLEPLAPQNSARYVVELPAGSLSRIRPSDQQSFTSCFTQSELNRPL